MNNRLRAVLALSAATACALATGATAVAAPTTHSNLRVEAIGETLEPGTNYSNGRITVRNSNACGDRVSRTERLGAGNAMGIVGHAAAVNPQVSPFRTSDTFASESGLVACEIGAYKGFTDQVWLYRVNHRVPLRSADRRRVGPDDDVLWYFANFSTSQNTGPALELQGVPVAVTPGQSFQVQVIGYPFGADPAPAQGMSVTGAAQPTGPDGTTAVTAPVTPGTMQVRATGDDEVPSARVAVCVNSNPAACPDARGESFVGTNQADEISATGGPDGIRPEGGRDLVRAGAEDDTINARGGGTDQVRCGSGNDEVRADSDDVLTDCEGVTLGP